MFQPESVIHRMSGVLWGRRLNLVRIEIVTEENDPPSGQVLTDDGDPIAFAGWLDLLRVLGGLLAQR